MFIILRNKKEYLNISVDLKETWNNIDDSYNNKWRESKS